MKIVNKKDHKTTTKALQNNNNYQKEGRKIAGWKKMPQINFPNN